jgi:hypothetical protein
MKKKKSNTLLPILLFAGALILMVGGLILANNLRKAEISNPGQYTNQDDIPRVSIQEALEAYQNNEAVIIDSRSQGAYDIQHVSGAINLPVDQIENRLEELDPDVWYLTYCT